MSNISDKAGESSAGKVAHTPGPWKIGGTTFFHDGIKKTTPLISIIAADEPFPTEIALAWISNDYPKRDLANARLIAASPELLAACNRLLDSSARGCPSTEKFLDEAIKLARAAVSKAEGGQS